jgi:hypothetical protein
MQEAPEVRIQDLVAYGVGIAALFVVWNLLRSSVVRLYFRHKVLRMPVRPIVLRSRIPVPLLLVIIASAIVYTTAALTGLYLIAGAMFTTRVALHFFTANQRAERSSGLDAGEAANAAIEWATFSIALYALEAGWYIGGILLLRDVVIPALPAWGIL